MYAINAPESSHSNLKTADTGGRMEAEARIYAASKQAGSQACFYTHLGLYLVANTVLLTTVFATENFVVDGGVWSGYIWSWWASIGCGVGVALHALWVFGLRGWIGWKGN